MNESVLPFKTKKGIRFIKKLVPDLLMLMILLLGAAYRSVGLEWDAGQHVHPDELFLTNVESSIYSVDNLSAYWDTETSTLNPHNQGHGFFVYGTLPIFLVRLVAEGVGQISYGELTLIGRQVSALFDLGIVLLVYLIGTRLYGKRVGVLAAFFSSFTVLDIQSSHFFTVDTAMNFFTYLCIYLAVIIATDRSNLKTFKFSHFLFFGAALGLAASSKVTTSVVAGLLPLAVFVRLQSFEKAQRNELAWKAFNLMVAAALSSVLVFRIFQPYAFSGPGFWGWLPNEKWLENLRYLANQASGDFDWPPSTQWARRPIWFSLQNLVLWGLGLPLAIPAWAGFIWVGAQIMKKKWQPHFVLWIWTAIYFGWQSTVFNPTMRYQLPIYPALAIYASWCLWQLWGWARQQGVAQKWKRVSLSLLSLLVAIISIVGTAAYATAFIQIYKQPHSRVAASEWIFNNIPGPMTLALNTDSGPLNQPIPYSYGYGITPETPYISSFVPRASGTSSGMPVHWIEAAPQTTYILMSIESAAEPGILLESVSASVNLDYSHSSSLPIEFVPSVPIQLEPHTQYIMSLSVNAGTHALILDGLSLGAFAGDQTLEQSLSEGGQRIADGQAIQLFFEVNEASIITSVKGSLRAADSPMTEPITLRLSLSDSPDFSQVFAISELSADLSAGILKDQVFIFNQQLNFVEGQQVYFKIESPDTALAITLKGAAIANETAWDLGLPLRVGYDGFGGIYQPALTLDMYADDNWQKRENFISILSEAEYIAISSSRQYASTTRIPERYPMVEAYYRALMGCPEHESVEYCYTVADLNSYDGLLGFDLIKIEVSHPQLFGISINDQFSEEAFTVYDHTKVFLFKKNAEFEQSRVTEILNAVDLSSVRRLTPKQASEYKAPAPDILLSEDVFVRQNNEGTWIELYKLESLINLSPILTVLAWYLALSLLGLASYPIVRQVMPGLQDRGYPLMRTAGLLLLAVLSWLLGSLGALYQRPVIAAVYLSILVMGGVLAARRWPELKTELKNRWRYFLSIEFLFLALFLLSLLVRVGNPDLWHPFKGGEKPMDFAYFNAVLKSISFPPYDPWYAGGAINYYYFGFVFVGTLVKLLGIVPAVAYNLIIPSLFAMFCLGAFSVAWNLYTHRKDEVHNLFENSRPYIVGLAAALGAGFIGNLGTLSMIFRGYQKLGAASLYNPDAQWISRVSWALKGFFQVIGGQALPYNFGDWYWLPSRVIPAPQDVEPITEFPWFTFIYGDLHAHMLALPLTVLALAWSLSVYFGALQKTHSKQHWIAVMAFGGLLIGALRPTNTWDLPTYLAIAMLAIFAGRSYAVQKSSITKGDSLKPLLEELGKAVLALIVLLVFVFGFFLPFSQSYVQAYGDIHVWTGTHTPSNSYWVHWGIFLFVIISWLVWESRQWMAATPLSALKKLEPYKTLIASLSAAVVLFMLVLHFNYQVRIYWIALPLAIWGAILIFRPGQAKNKIAALFILGTALFLTLMVEVIVLVGDIGRMNTVFKFYLQAWVLFAVVAAVGLGWLLDEIEQWAPRVRNTWRNFLILLVGLGLLYPLLASTAKIKDRFSAETPPGLDGLAYMQTATYYDQGQELDLNEDYKLIRWMQTSIEGTPVIVECLTPIYHWGSRISINTGLPTVLGWDWHQIQQRAGGPPQAVNNRIEAVNAFYATENIEEALSFLEKYKVSYIVVGQLEYAFYPEGGLLKFERFAGIHWDLVYQDGDTYLYKVRN